MSREIPPTRRRYDTREVISALQKTIRRGQPREALFWAVELDQSGYTAWAWKRLKVIASEDVGIADPTIAAEIRALFDNWSDDRKQHPGGGMYLTHAVLRLATAKKSRLACLGLMVEASDQAERIEIPDEALDKHTLRGRQMGRGRQHFNEVASQLIQFDGDLDALEVEYRERWRQVSERPNLPKTRTSPPSGQVSASEQLKLGGDR